MMKLGRIRLGDDPKIAVSFRGGVSVKKLRRLRREGLDIAELRIDLFRSRQPHQVVKQVRRFKSVPTIATIRSESEGGRWQESDEKRLALFRAVMPYVNAVDIELSSRFILAETMKAAKRARKLTIVSYHNFVRTPHLNELNKLWSASNHTGADVTKIACFPNNETDLKRLSIFTATHAKKGLIVIALGKRGSTARLLLPFLGSLIAFVHTGKPSGPGQLSLKKTASVFKGLASMR